MRQLEGENVSQARAVEVTALLGDSVVDTRHLVPGGGRVSRTTWAIAASAALALLVAVGAFAHGVSVARENQRALHQWTEIDGLPAIEFRARKVSAAGDVLIITGLAGAVAFSAWALGRARRERVSPLYRIGTAEGVELPTAAAPAASFTLVEPQGDAFVFAQAPGMTGELFHDGRLVPLAGLPARVTVPAGARIRATLGQNTFAIASVPAPRKDVGAGPLWGGGAVLGFLGVSALAHGVALLLLFMMPDDTRGAAFDDDRIDGRLVRISSKPSEDAKPLEHIEKPAPESEPGRAGEDGGGAAHVGPSGVLGKTDSTSKDKATFQIAKVDGKDPQLARERSVWRASNEGMMGILKRNGGAFKSITGGEFEVGVDLATIEGGLVGERPGESAGNGGWGTEGPGWGADGRGWNTVGLNRYNTIGFGRSTGSHYKPGMGTGSPRGHEPGGPIAIGPIQSGGDYDKSIIRRYVRQKLEQLQYCYERELTVKPGLEGTVDLAFTIDGMGRVMTIRATGMDEDVASCAAGVVKSVEFPKPPSLIEVTSYPIHYRSPGK